MITIEAVLSDIDKIEADIHLSDTKKMIRVIKVAMKFISTMRSNQLLPESQKIAIQNAKEIRQQKKR